MRNMNYVTIIHDVRGRTSVRHGRSRNVTKHSVYNDSAINGTVGSQSFNIAGASRGWDDGVARK